MPELSSHEINLILQRWCQAETGMPMSEFIERCRTEPPHFCGNCDIRENHQELLGLARCLSHGHQYHWCQKGCPKWEGSDPKLPTTDAKMAAIQIRIDNLHGRINNIVRRVDDIEKEASHDGR
jgi:hypothetical protein